MASHLGITSVLLLCASVIEVRTQTDCRFNWKRFHNSCYLFSTIEANWPDAEAYCTNFDAYLTEIDSAEENTFLKRTLQDYDSHGRKRAPSDAYWIGGNDIEVEQHFMWSKHGIAFTFTDWMDNQPDDGFDTREDCVEMRQDFNYRWNDMDCTENQNFICEMAVHVAGGSIIG